MTWLNLQIFDVLQEDPPHVDVHHQQMESSLLQIKRSCFFHVSDIWMDLDVVRLPASDGLRLLWSFAVLHVSRLHRLWRGFECKSSRSGVVFRMFLVEFWRRSDGGGVPSIWAQRHVSACFLGLSTTDPLLLPSDLGYSRLYSPHVHAAAAALVHAAQSEPIRPALIWSWSRCKPGGGFHVSAAKVCDEDVCWFQVRTRTRIQRLRNRFL